MLSNKPYIETYKKKLKRYNFTAILEEPTYGEEIVKSELSQGAYELITEWQRDIYFNKEFLRDYFELRKFPISEKVINFFCIYGGKNFCFENDLLFNNTIQINGGYIIQSFPIHADEKNGNLYSETNFNLKVSNKNLNLLNREEMKFNDANIGFLTNYLEVK
ncbi:hypothetical protein [Clostridium sp. YIM B02555]|uniref:hypothetical protein n=1 Tax=Clostridium sp. YIM B02555 TaxID=2911968 RepID=UPI001EEF008C|nr:hypothetical protein [Clostridium sp. YIM B02555]